MLLIRDYYLRSVIIIDCYHLNYGQWSMKKSIWKKVKSIGNCDARKESDTKFSFVIYSYRPDGTSDPFSETGIIWSFNFFFHNKRLRRVLFVTCRADCKTATNDEGNEEGDSLDTNNYMTFDE